jgi:hypothetical protein
MQMMTDEWLRLRELRDTLLNRTTLAQYLGYGHGQMQRLENGTRLHSAGGQYNTKWAYHMVRLALDAERISQGQPPKVMKDGGELQLLMDIRHNKYEAADVVRIYREIEDRIDKAPADLPEAADQTLLETWLLHVRMKDFGL